MARLTEQIAALEAGVQGNPSAMLVLAGMLQDDGQGERALALCRSALLLAPDDEQLAVKAKRITNAHVPQWHFNIVRDEARNAAYEAALNRAVTAGSRVLEIGTGTGLLAMMAARAGAAEVITCEKTSVIAAKAAEIVALNGYGDRVRVIAKHSSELEVGTDMAGRADVLVSEIVSNDILGQDVLAAHERAVRDLLKPGARVIPARAAARVALAHDGRDGPCSLTNVRGFDLSAFAALAQPARQMRVGQEWLSLRSEAADLFVFELGAGQFCPPSRASLKVRSLGGPVNGIAQWIALEMDEVVRYENCPAPGAASCWAMLFHPFTRTVETVAGQELCIAGAHDRHSLMMWIEADTPAV